MKMVVGGVIMMESVVMASMILVEWQLMKKNWLNAMGFIIVLLNFIFQMISQILELYFDWKPSFI